MQDAFDFWSARVPGNKIAEIDAMWVRFAKAAPGLQAMLAAEVPDRRQLDQAMRPVLGEFAGKLEPDFAPGPAGPGTHTLVLSAGMAHQHRVLARAALDNAPDLRGWAFTDARPALRDATDADRVVARRDKAGSFKLAAVEPKIGPHRRLALEPSGNGDDTVLLRQAGLLFGLLLGEDVARDWMGPAEIKKRGLLGRIGGRSGKIDARWCPDFRDRCNLLIGEVRTGLPDRPFAEQEYDRGKQVMYQANRLELDPAWRHDTITGYTVYRQMCQARMMGDPVAGARFSRFGESFCGLKIARTPDCRFDEIEQRVALAEGAHMMLSGREEGGVTGEASGRSHVYVDLALTDLSGGIATLAELLDKIELTGPAWLIFDEAGLTDLAIPLTPKTPSIPKPSYA